MHEEKIIKKWMAHEIVRDFHPAVLEALGRLDESIPLRNNKCFFKGLIKSCTFVCRPYESLRIGGDVGHRRRVVGRNGDLVTILGKIFKCVAAGPFAYFLRSTAPFPTL